MPNQVTLGGDIKAYDSRIQTGFMEGLALNVGPLVTGSRGAIRIRDQRLTGNYAIEANFVRPSNLIQRRDPTSNAAVDTMKVTQTEKASVSLSRRIGPASFSLTAFQRAGISFDSFLNQFGRTAAEEVIKEQMNTGLAGLAAALYGQAASRYVHLDTSSAKKAMDTGALADGLALMGDASDRVLVWVLHSKHFHKLVKEQIAAPNTQGAIAIQSGVPATLNRPYIVVDSPSLVRVTGSGSTAVTSYLSVGLTESALEVINSEPETIILGAPQTGSENIVYPYQGEYGYNVSVKGFTWDMANGGANPTDAALATGTNWDTIFADVKNRAGVVIEAL